MQSLIYLIFPIQSLIILSSSISISFPSLLILLQNSDLYKHISIILMSWVIQAYSYFLFISLSSFLLCLLYISQLSNMCCFASISPHLWQLIYCASINFLICNVSLDPSHPILILNIYLISLILCLFVLIYSCALTSYFSSPNSQNSFKVGNSFCIQVLLRAFLMISLLIYYLMIPCHFSQLFSQ